MAFLNVCVFFSSLNTGKNSILQCGQNKGNILQSKQCIIFKITQNIFSTKLFILQYTFSNEHLSPINQI